MKQTSRRATASRSRAKRGVTRPRAVPQSVQGPPPLMLGTVLGRGALGFRVKMGRVERELAVDDAVDPALLTRVGTRVVVEGGVEGSETPLIVGCLVTHRALELTRDGRVNARVTDFRVTSKKDVLLRTQGAFVHVTGKQVEMFADRVVTRARELAKILGRLIKLN